MKKLNRFIFHFRTDIFFIFGSRRLNILF